MPTRPTSRAASRGPRKSDLVTPMTPMTPMMHDEKAGMEMEPGLIGEGLPFPASEVGPSQSCKNSFGLGYIARLLWFFIDMIGHTLHTFAGVTLVSLGFLCLRNVWDLRTVVAALASMVTNDTAMQDLLVRSAWMFNYFLIFYGLYLLNCAVVFFADLLPESRYSK